MRRGQSTITLIIQALVISHSYDLSLYLFYLRRSAVQNFVIQQGSQLVQRTQPSSFWLQRCLLNPPFLPSFPTAPFYSGAGV